MKIVFWSPGEQTGTTTSMAAMAMAFCAHQNERVILMQNKGNQNDIEQVLSRETHQSFVKEESAYFALEGMDYLIWQEQNHRLDWDCMKESLISLMEGKLFYLPSGKREKLNLYPEQAGKLQERIIDKIEQYSGYTFIDCGHRQDNLTKKLIHEADLLVVNLMQKRELLDSYFTNYAGRKGRVIYLLCQYDYNDVYNVSNLSRIYRIPQEQICLLPYYQPFQNACEKGKLEQFFRRNYSCNSGSAHFYFMKNLKHNVHQMLQFVQTEVESGRCV